MDFKFKESFKIPFLSITGNIVTNANNRFVKLTGYTKSELMGKTIDEIKELLKLNCQNELKNMDKGCRCYILTKEYDVKETFVSCCNIEDEHGTGNIKYLFFNELKNKYLDEELQEAFSYYITEIMENKKLIEKQNNELAELKERLQDKNNLEKALKMQDELLVNLSHELKTPLNIIYSAIQLMEMYLKSENLENNLYKVFKSVDSVKQNCYRLTRLVNNIIDLSKIETGYIRMNIRNEDIVNIVKCIVDSVIEYVRSKKINISFETDVEELYIACDSEKIERVVLNLISNAIKFTPTGGNITVRIQCGNETVEISVIDNGIGIEEKYLNEIFNRFGQVDKSLSRNAEGSGLGLHLVKSIIEMHGGKVSVESKVGNGSMFKVELPVETVKAPESLNGIVHTSNKIEMINIEFSDIYENGWFY